MEKNILGRTKLEVTVAGLGSGGHSRLGMAKFGQDHAAEIVRRAFENGVNFFDTATAYGTESAVGQGLKSMARDQYVLSTKFPYKNNDGSVKSMEDLEKTLDQSLRSLNTDHVDIYHLHGVQPDDYERAMDTLLPAMHKAKDQGKIRFLGITELFGADTSHVMLQKMLPDNYFDVIMAGYNIINPSAAKTVLPAAQEKDVGVLCMFAVRSALSNPEQLKIDIRRILEHCQAEPGLVKDEKALDFLKESGAAASIMEAAYRFCRYTDGIGVTLTGTGNPGHLLDNLKSIQMPPLPAETISRLGVMFANVDCVSGQ
jgi:aryl-alcohol dehydrogenase-like predicted oxidoreductase